MTVPVTVPVSVTVSVTVTVSVPVTGSVSVIPSGAGLRSGCSAREAKGFLPRRRGVLASHAGSIGHGAAMSGSSSSLG